MRKTLFAFVTVFAAACSQNKPTCGPTEIAVECPQCQTDHGPARPNERPYLCVPFTCTDGVKDNDELDVDCGGLCNPCGDGKNCNRGPDCASGVCTNNKCVAAPALDAGTDAAAPCNTALSCHSSPVNSCVNLANCGACDKVCDLINGFCIQGRCECQAGWSLCGKLCVEPGKPCPATDGGVPPSDMSIVCIQGTKPCGNVCVDTMIDLNNCGACGNKCASGQGCLKGVCTTPTANGPCWPSTVNLPPGTIVTALSFWDRNGVQLQTISVTTTGGSFKSPDNACAANVDFPNRNSLWVANGNKFAGLGGLPQATVALTYPGKGTVGLCELNVGMANWGVAHDGASCK